jgi:hypothetical protein
MEKLDHLLNAPFDEAYFDVYYSYLQDKGEISLPKIGSIEYQNLKFQFLKRMDPYKYTLNDSNSGPICPY